MVVPLDCEIEIPLDDVVVPLLDDMEPTLDHADARLTPPYGGSATAQSARILGIRCALDITEQPPSPEDVYFPGLAVAGETSGLASYGGSGASTFLLNLGVATAGGATFLDAPPKPPKRVLVIEFEDPKWRIRQKLDAIAAAYGLDVRSTLARIDVANMDDSGPIRPELLDEAIRQYRPALVLIAPFARLASDTLEFDEENSNIQVHRLAHAYSQVARQTKTALIVNAHTAKYKRVTSFRIDDVRGGSALTRHARMFAAFGTLNDARDVWRLVIAKDNLGLRRPPSPFTFDLVSADGFAAFRLATGTERTAMVTDVTRPSQKYNATDRVRKALARFIEKVPAGQRFNRSDALDFVRSDCPDIAKETAKKRIGELLPTLADPIDGQRRVWRPRKRDGVH